MVRATESEGRGGGKVTTHVLDTSVGRPAAGVRVRLYVRRRAEECDIVVGGGSRDWGRGGDGGGESRRGSGNGGSGSRGTSEGGYEMSDGGSGDRSWGGDEGGANRHGSSDGGSGDREEARYENRDGGSWEFRLLKEDFTNAEGRLDAPLFTGELETDGEYELVFEAGRYFREQNVKATLPFETVPVRFRAADPFGPHPAADRAGRI